MCVIDQSEIKVADADMIVYKIVGNSTCYDPSCKDGEYKTIKCLNIFHRSTDPVTGNNIIIPCTRTYVDPAIGFENGAGYSCFVSKPDLSISYRGPCKIFIIKKGVRYKTGTIYPDYEFGNSEVIQAETLVEFNPTSIEV